MANPLREVIAAFLVDTKGVEEGVAKSEGLVDGLTGKLKQLGGALVGVFAAKSVLGFAQATLAQADATAKLAQTLGMGVAELQGWQYAADQSGLAVEALNASLFRLQKAAAAAAAGQGPVAQIFRRLDVSAKDASGQLRGTGEILDDILSALHAMEDPVQRNAYLMQLFGDQGAKMVPLLEEGAEGIAKLRQEVLGLGAGMGPDFAENAQEFSSATTRLKVGLRGLMVQALGPLLPGLIQLTDLATGLAKGFVSITKTTGQWLKQTKLIEAALALLASKTLAILVGQLGKAIAGVGGLRAAFMRLLPLIWKVIAPMLILEDLFVFLAGGQSAFGEIVKRLFGDGSADKFRESLLEIISLLKDGDIGAALEKVFQHVAQMFAAIGEQLTKGFVKLWNSIVDRSGRLGQMLGLQKIDPDEVDDNRSAYERDRERADRIRSGEETAQERWVREQQLPGIYDLQNSLEDLGAGIGRLAPVAPQLAHVPTDAEGNVQLSRMADAVENWVEVSGRRPEMSLEGVSPLAPPQNVENHVTFENRIQVQVPPGTDEDMARRVGASTTRGVQQGFDVRAIQAALVPQPAR